MKKLPSTDTSDVSITDILCALFRMRLEQGNDDLNSGFHRFLCRTAHAWCQLVENQLEKRLLETCPDPTVGARVHPFMKSARMKGNKSLEMSLCSRFCARGGGFISLKDTTVSKMGLVPLNSSLATRTCGEFATRTLIKTAEYMKDVSAQSTVLNFCFDCAFVSEEHVSCLNIFTLHMSFLLDFVLGIHGRRNASKD